MKGSGGFWIDILWSKKKSSNWCRENLLRDKMTDKQIKQRVALLFRQLDVMDLLEDEFMEKLGKKGYDEKVNSILDEANFWRKELKKRAKKRRK